MPVRGHRSAQSSAAAALVQAKGISAHLDSFLEGHVPGAAASSPRDEGQRGEITMNLKLLTKSSDITKQKALNELIRLMRETSEETVVSFAANVAEVVLRHAQYSNPVVRAAVFALLRTMMTRGKDVKLGLVPSLAALSGPWLMVMNDMEPTVLHEARAAFEAAFAPDKRAAMLLRYHDDMLHFVCDTVDEIVASGRPLQDDNLDARANTLYSCLRALGYLVKQLSASHAAVLAFVMDRPSFAQLLPLKGKTTTKGYLAAKTPLVRSAVLALLRDVLTTCPSASRLQQMVSQAVNGAILDDNVTVASRVWELLLVWVKKSASDAMAHFAPDFLDRVVDSVMQCERAELAEIIYPSLFPLLTVLSRDVRCTAILDEFCGALVVKLQRVAATPNVSARELQHLLHALLECWELHCVRKKGTDAASDSEELFALIALNIVTLLRPVTKYQRYVGVATGAMAKSLLKTSLRNETAFRHCMMALTAQPDAPYPVLSAAESDGEEDAAELQRCFARVRAIVIGKLYAMAVQEGTYTRQLPTYGAYLNDALGAQLATEDHVAMRLLLESAGTAYRPSRATRDAVVRELVRLLLPHTSDVTGDGEATSGAAAAASAARAEDVGDSAVHEARIALLAIALGWGDAESVVALRDVAARVQMPSVQEAVKKYLLDDPATVHEVLLESCAHSQFADVERCVQRCVALRLVLPEERRAAVWRAIEAALQETLDLATGVPRDGSDAGSEKDSNEGTSRHTLTHSATVSGGSNSDGEDESDGDGRGTAGRSEGAEEEGEEEEEENMGLLVLMRVARWCELLARDAPLARLLELDAARVERELAERIYWLVAAVAPRVYAEQYVCIKALRVVLQNPHDVLARAMERKSSFLKVDAFAALVERVTALLQSYGIVNEDDGETNDGDTNDATRGAASGGTRDAFAEAMLAQLRDAAAQLPPPYHAVHQLQHAVPFASTPLLRRFATAPATWHRLCVAHRYAAEGDGAVIPPLQNDGAFLLAELRPTLWSAVRLGQLLRLFDFCEVTQAEEQGDKDEGSEAGQSPPLAATAQRKAAVFDLLLHAVAAREVLSPTVLRLLYGKLLPQAFAAFDDAAAAAHLAHLVAASPATAHRVATVGAVVRDLARRVAPSGDESARVAFVLRARRVMGAITSHVVQHLFPTAAATGRDRAGSAVCANIAPDLAAHFTTFYTFMDAAATAVRENLLAQLPSTQERLLLEGCCCLPDYNLTTSKLALVVHRHLSTMPVVAESTVRSLLAYAQRHVLAAPLESLELLAELACTRILHQDAYNDLVRAVGNGLQRCYRLQHLPSNGRLLVAHAASTDGDGLATTTSMSVQDLGRVVMAAIQARQGVVMHSRMDAVLRSTVNLIVFDVVAESVRRLRTTQGGDEAAQLAQLVARTSQFMTELLTSDVAVLRGSEVSLRKITSVLCFAYLWLYTSPIPRLEAIGLDIVAEVLRSVCLLANLTLMNVSVPLQEALRRILDRPAVRPIRDDFSSATPARLSQLRQHNANLAKAPKHQLLLFPYLLAWCIYLTVTPAQQEQSASAATSMEAKEWAREVNRLLDLLCSLLLSPLTTLHSKRLEDTFLGAPLQDVQRGGGSPPAAAAVATVPSLPHAVGEAGAEDGAMLGVVGFEVVALTRTHATDGMAQLARGAAAVLTLLMHGHTLMLMKNWLDTVERKLQALVYDFVDRFISPLLIQESLLTVLSHSPDGAPQFTLSENFTVQVSTARRTVDLSYEKEDVRLSMRIVLPSAFPLRPAVLEYTNDRSCGVSTDKWRSWVTKMSVMLFGGSASVWECVELFHRNLDAHFAGLEPCPICFTVVSAVDHKLPTMQCSMCHNTPFHASCLYTWWANGGQTVCPLCRAPWVAE